MIVVVGCGVRGATVAALLAGHGVGELALVDGGFVEQGDVGRHPLQFTPDVNASKPEALAAKLGLINPAVHAQPFPANLDADNAVAILTGARLAIDCVGSDEVRDALATAASELGIAVIDAPADFSTSDSSDALAVAAAGDQAERALAALG